MSNPNENQNEPVNESVTQSELPPVTGAVASAGPGDQGALAKVAEGVIYSLVGLLAVVYMMAPRPVCGATSSSRARWQERQLEIQQTIAREEAQH